MILFPLLVLLTSLCAVGVALRRLGQSERERTALERDLTERMGGEEKREALAAVGLVAAQLCDMIISPVTVILGQCELARSKGTADPRLGTIERQARRIADVVERHRGLAADSRGAIREIDPAACARAALGAVVDLARERDVVVHEMLDESPRIRINPFLLTHALRHLLAASIAAAPRGTGDVTFAMGCLPGARGEEDYLAFAVADDGPGIEPLQLPRVFHPFPEDHGSWRGAPSAYAVAYAIACATSSTLVVDTAPGAGTRATLKVPLPKVAPVQQTLSEETPSPSVARRVRVEA